MSHQPSLNLNIKTDTTLRDFQAHGYTSVVEAVHRLCQGDILELFIVGGYGVGKTHLALAIYDEYTHLGKTAISLSLKEMIDTDTSVLIGLETFDLIILDDIQTVAKNEDWQEAIFHLINRVRQLRHQLVFLANLPPRELDISLLDLTTRLSVAPMVRLPNGSDIDDRQSILSSLLRRKNWRLPEEIFDFFVQEGPHNAKDMNIILEDISALLTHLSRVQVSKKTIYEAKQMILHKTFSLELDNIDNS